MQAPYSTLWFVGIAVFLLVNTPGEIRGLDCGNQNFSGFQIKAVRGRSLPCRHGAGMTLAQGTVSVISRSLPD